MSRPYPFLDAAVADPEPEPGADRRGMVPTKAEAGDRLAVANPLVPLKASEAAAFLGMHVNTLKRLGDTGPRYHVINTRGDRRYRLADLAAWQEANTHGGSTQA